MAAMLEDVQHAYAARVPLLKEPLPAEPFQNKAYNFKKKFKTHKQFKYR